MPWTDWQFWVVTMFALGGLAVVIRPLIPGRNSNGRCGTCPTSTDPSVGKRTTLTIEGHRVDRTPAIEDRSNND
ncbi:MAG: hypothetical protein GY895_22320 [Phycisphaera sp.]|nr:hypothetical protein [Phycisphaera sp.]